MNQSSSQVWKSVSVITKMVQEILKERVMLLLFGGSKFKKFSIWCAVFWNREFEDDSEILHFLPKVGQENWIKLCDYTRITNKNYEINFQRLEKMCSILIFLLIKPVRQLEFEFINFFLIRHVYSTKKCSKLIYQKNLS